MLRRSIITIVTTLLLAVAAGISFVGIWQREHPGEKLFGKPEATLKIVGVTSIRVYEIQRDGTEMINDIEDGDTIVEILSKLSSAQRTFFGDPEPMGQLYQVEFVQGSASEVYELNDLRGTGSTFQAKIYPQHPERDEVWLVPPGVLDELVVKAAPA
ncbi:hypothetical protein COLU111180_16400 [Cohnella lubricantis]|uniref:Uncharacterized protein n=1 Tax=Cohnella lubricantis TaxID=2163172 RepID=A0A841T6T5_9BACL|nr:hypothetical protein [Cohnella lubricantis]MBB6677044.1 hypothetical protein [Cohnella lubricantis]MBP2119286.1 hypothetical protein [Cohnella lubricantis]